MKTIRLTTIIILALLFSARSMAQQGAARQQSEAKSQQTDANGKQLVVPLSEPGKPYKLNVNLVFGSIKVTSYEGKDVIIDVTSSDSKRERPDREGNGMKRLSGGDNLDITAHEKNNEVNIGSDMPLKAVTLNIKVPQGATNIKLSTVNNGIIFASGLNGQIEAENSNGSIELKDVSGSVVANTNNGNVTVALRSVDPKAPMAFTTLNGNIDVTLPATIKANVKARSERDNVYSDFEFTAEPSQAKTSKSAKDGMYRLTVEDWITGKIGGGGPEMMFKTMNGNIYIRKAK